MNPTSVSSFAILAILSGCGQSSASEQAAEEVAEEHAVEHQPAFLQIELSPADGPLLTQLAQHAEQARALNRKPVIYVHAAWCGPCNAVDRYAQHPSMMAAFAGTHIARVDLDAWSEQLEAFRLHMSVPVWADLDPAGRPGHERISSSVWGEDIPANMAGPLGTFFRRL